MLFVRGGMQPPTRKRGVSALFHRPTRRCASDRSAALPPQARLVHQLVHCEREARRERNGGKEAEAEADEQERLALLHLHGWSGTGGVAGCTDLVRMPRRHASVQE